MSFLIALPRELLDNILEEVGGRDLRRGKGAAARLSVCHDWYHSALPVYRSGLATTNIKIYGHNLSDLDTRLGFAGLRPLMHKNTRHLSVQLLGHFWDEITTSPIIDNEYEDGDNGEIRNQIPFDTAFEILPDWRDGLLQPILEELSLDLKNFSMLESLTFEASSEQPRHDGVDGLHWNYLYASTIVTMLHNLPIAHDLSSLTLDLNGLKHGLLDDDGCVCIGHATSNICEPLGEIMLRIEKVRLRLPVICPAIFKSAAHALSKIPHAHCGEVKLRNLTIKLHHPAYPDPHELTGVCHDEEEAPVEDKEPDVGLQELLFEASPLLLDGLAKVRHIQGTKSMHGMEGFRISDYPLGPPPGIRIIDCLTMTYYIKPTSEATLNPFYMFDQFDASRIWFELDEPDRLKRGPFPHPHASEK